MTLNKARSLITQEALWPPSSVSVIRPLSLFMVCQHKKKRKTEHAPSTFNFLCSVRVKEKKNTLFFSALWIKLCFDLCKLSSFLFISAQLEVLCKLLIAECSFVLHKMVLMQQHPHSSNTWAGKRPTQTLRSECMIYVPAETLHPVRLKN